MIMKTSLLCPALLTSSQTQTAAALAKHTQPTLSTFSRLLLGLLRTRLSKATLIKSSGRLSWNTITISVRI